MLTSRRAFCVSGAMSSLALASKITFAADSTPFPRLPSDAELRTILIARINALIGQQTSIGIVVGIIAPSGRRFVSHGQFDKADSRNVGADTVFEIASVTKTFTALLLAQMVQASEVALSDPVSKYLPAKTRVPKRGGRFITLLDLATHTSGLPFMPDELPEPGNLGTAHEYFLHYITDHELRRDIGVEWEYSNLGYWLLGQALSARGGMDFEQLLLTRIIAPMNLAHTGFALSTAMKDQLAVGHDAGLERAPPTSTLAGYWAMPAGGGLYSTVYDLLTFLSIAMRYEISPLTDVMTSTLLTRRRISKSGTEQALGWVVYPETAGELVFHEGGSFGHASAVAWDPAARVGVVVLSNHVAGVSDIARHVLRWDYPLRNPEPMRHTEIPLNVKILERYAGSYEAVGEGSFEITLDGDHLTVQAPPDWGLPTLRLRPASEWDFFVTELPLRIAFQPDASGNVTGLLLHPPRGQLAVPAHRAAANP